MVRHSQRQDAGARGRHQRGQRPGAQPRHHEPPEGQHVGNPAGGLGVVDESTIRRARSRLASATSHRSHDGEVAEWAA